MEDIINKARKCWGSLDYVYPTNDELIIQERIIRIVIGN